MDGWKRQCLENVDEKIFSKIRKKKGKEGEEDLNKCCRGEKKEFEDIMICMILK